ncbi:GGDEF domain-containing protein [Williamsia sp.]|uniref:GGDEF domain-containing protein n=1 Tax=Williamsia sp. TaxID=1872085 RepID=UPI001A1C2264|nr:GGDEF domain-containing protein [Williamsia sp.]MBJ7291077.1 GGDEF domain-containing protein [Williamsia sp.]
MSKDFRMRERLIRLSIAAFVPGFGIIAVIMVFSREGPGTPTQRIVALAVAGSTIPVAVVIARTELGPIWWIRESHWWSMNHALVIYGDLGVTTVLVTFSTPEASLFGTTLFAVVSVYVANFAETMVRNLHIVFTSMTIGVFAVLTWRSGMWDPAGCIARAVVAGAVVNGTVLLQSVHSIDVRRDIHGALQNAHRDPLTGLWNRRGFTYWAIETIKCCDRCFGVLVIDLDRFKHINDAHGHHVGDDVLQLAARRLREVVGDVGSLARTGGDEFAVAAGIDVGELMDLAHAIRTAVHQPADQFPVTVTIGVAGRSTDHTHDPAATLSSTLREADAALYRGKQEGRNRIALAPPWPIHGSGGVA